MTVTPANAVSVGSNVYPQQPYTYPMYYYPATDDSAIKLKLIKKILESDKLDAEQLEIIKLIVE